MYKITFKLKSPICFIDIPIFDSILSYCYMKEYHSDKMVFKDLTISKDNLIDFRKFNDFPIKLHESGLYFISSYMFYDTEKYKNFTGTWKKRWANQYDFIADFGKNKRKIDINKGKFKSYDMPLNLHSIKEVWFYFDSDNIKKIEYLIYKHLFGIGKKTSQGYGEIQEMSIEQIDYNPFEKTIRPIPIKSLNLSDSEKTKLMIEGKIKMSCYYPVYYNIEAMEFCLCE